MIRAKHILVLGLLVIFLLPTISRLSIVLNYAINTEYIVAMFCINKDKPQMKCNGKCHLKTQLEEQDKKEQSPTTSTKEEIDILLFYKNLCSSQILNSTICSGKASFIYLCPPTEEHLPAVFHPPMA